MSINKQNNLKIDIGKNYFCQYNSNSILFLHASKQCNNFYIAIFIPILILFQQKPNANLSRKHPYVLEMYIYIHV